MYKLTWINEEDGGELNGRFSSLYDAKMAAWLVAGELDEGDKIQAWELDAEGEMANTAAAEWMTSEFGDPHATITLNESGWDTGIEFIDYCRQARLVGDDPSEYSTFEEHFRFVGLDYAKTDPFWNDESLAEWPESLPVWSYTGE